jgi:hypothetical protein
VGSLVPHSLEFRPVSSDTLNMLEQRRASRRDFLAQVQVLWLSETGQPQRSQALTEDLSCSGLCLRMKCRVTVGSRVEIQLVNKTYVGLVRRCCRSGAGHVLGIEFCEPDPRI